jgi:hypothetical protein
MKHKVEAWLRFFEKLRIDARMPTKPFNDPHHSSTKSS